MDQQILERISNDPYAKYLGIKVEEIKEGYAKVSMVVTKDHLNIHRSANGGAIFPLADIAFAVASNTYDQVG